MHAHPQISVVVPLFNEEHSVTPLVESIRHALDERYEWELLLVDDGSTDATAVRAAELSHDDSRVRGFRLARNYGQTTALQAGFDHARGEVVVSMDGDLQNDAADIPRLVAELDEGYDLVAGYREARRDGWLTRHLPSRVANLIIRMLTGVPIRDIGCSLRAYRRELVDGLELYSEMHRYLPVLAAATAGARITEIPVKHHERRFGESKYGLGRTWRVLLDLAVLTMIRWFRDRPLALFTLAALVPLLAGLAFSAGTVIAAVWLGGYESTAYVFPGSALLCFGLAVYLVMLGLLAEVVLRGHRPPGRLCFRGAARG